MADASRDVTIRHVLSAVGSLQAADSPGGGRARDQPEAVAELIR